MPEISEGQKIFNQQALVYKELLYRFAMRMTRDAATANELVFKTYLKAGKCWDKCYQERYINLWLCRILKDCFINEYRIKLEEQKIMDGYRVSFPSRQHIVAELNYME
jgi:DNA-directed RNA polymerase specialized sigma24 family protein